MLLDIIKQFNWVDIFIIIILIRVCCVAMNRGFNVELFKLPGTIFAIYLSFHYYTALADLIVKHIGKKKIPLEFTDFLCFTILAILGYLLFIILREAFLRFIKLEAVPVLNKWGGLILGIGRGFLLASLLIFMLVVSSVEYFKTSVLKSYSGVRFYKIAPFAYQYIWDNIMSKFSPSEKFNETILETEEGLQK